MNEVNERFSIAVISLGLIPIVHSSPLCQVVMAVTGIYALGSGIIRLSLQKRKKSV